MGCCCGGLPKSWAAVAAGGGAERRSFRTCLWGAGGSFRLAMRGMGGRTGGKGETGELLWGLFCSAKWKRWGFGSWMSWKCWGLVGEICDDADSGGSGEFG